MSARAKTILSLAAVGLWCAFIFFMSAKVAVDSDALSLGLVGQVLSLVYPGFGGMSLADQLALVQSFNHPVRKLAHFSEYAVLGALALNAARRLQPQLRHAPALAWGFSVFYAATDELHQLFVPGRACMFSDVCIDAAGALLGVLLLALVLRAGPRAFPGK